jgi:hypothetical protein
VLVNAEGKDASEVAVGAPALLEIAGEGEGKVPVLREEGFT